MPRDLLAPNQPQDLLARRQPRDLLATSNDQMGSVDGKPTPVTPVTFNDRFRTFSSYGLPAAVSGMRKEDIDKSLGDVAERTFDVPGAAARSFLQGTGYAYGAQNNRKIPRFQDLAIQATNENINKFDPQAGTAERFAIGMPASATGMALDVATNPGELAAMWATEGLSRKLPKVIEDVRNNIGVNQKVSATATKENLMGQARKLTSELLQPPISRTVPSTLKGDTSPAIESATKYMRPSKDYGEMMRNFQDTAGQKMNTRNFILENAGDQGAKVGKEYLQPLEEFLANKVDPKSITSGHISESDIGKISTALNDEKAFLEQHDNQLSPIEAQQRKEYLQNLTDKLLSRREKGVSVDLDPLKNQALDKLRYGLKSGIEEVSPMVRRLNEPYGGLKEAARLSARQFDIAQKATPPSAFEKIVGPVRSLLTGGGRERTAAELAKMAFERNQNLSGKTRRIAELVRQANAINNP